MCGCSKGARNSRINLFWPAQSGSLGKSRMEEKKSSSSLTPAVEGKSRDTHRTEPCTGPATGPGPLALDLGSAPVRVWYKNQRSSAFVRGSGPVRFFSVWSGVFLSGPVLLIFLTGPIRCFFPLQPVSSPIIYRNTHGTGTCTRQAPNTQVRSGPVW